MLSISLLIAAALPFFLFTVIFLPSVFHTKDVKKIVWIIGKEGKIGSVFAFAFVVVLSILNRTMVMVEDYLFPSLRRIEEEYFNKPNKIVFILGHPRSGTTNIHKAVSGLN
jgi:hypothetical protein